MKERRLNLKKFPEKIIDQAYSMMEAYVLQEYDIVLNCAEGILKQYRDRETGLVRLYRAHALLEKGKKKQSARILNDLEKEFPENKLVLVYQAYYLMKTRDYRKAKAKLKAIGEPETCRTLYFEVMKVLQERFRDEDDYHEKLKNAVSKSMDVSEADDMAELFFTDKGIFQLLQYDAENDLQEEMEEDMAMLFDWVKGASLDGTEEAVLSREISLLCPIAASKKWSRDYFKQIITFFDEEDLFHDQNEIIASGYLSIESFEAYDHPEYARLYDICLEVNSQSEEFFADHTGGMYAMAWLLALEAEKGIDKRKEFFERFPRYSSRAKNLINHVYEDPQKMQEECIKILMDYSGESREKILVELEKMEDDSIHSSLS